MSSSTNSTLSLQVRPVSNEHVTRLRSGPTRDAARRRRPDCGVTPRSTAGSGVPNCTDTGERLPHAVWSRRADSPQPNVLDERRTRT
jgi:hypothetical protein